ncbi:MAG: trypsin-like serine protease [Myxococcales bacterium]|nr:MAG: trypsin-like serine protease [Myxococcales bacterium]
MLSACMEGMDEDLDVSGHPNAIIDGIDDAGHESVLFIIADGALCTGALIAPKVVLTAKHCILDVRTRDIEVGIGSSVFIGGTYADVVEVVTTEGDDLENKDIALLILDEAGSLPVFDWVADNPPKKGDTITAVGYGQQEVGPSNTSEAGTKQKATSEIIQLNEKEFLIDGPTTCFGDSGGPALLDDGRIFGVVSRGVSNCNGISLYTRTDAFVSLINSALVQSGSKANTGNSTETTNSTSGGVAISSNGTILNTDGAPATSVSDVAASAEGSGETDASVPQANDTGCSIQMRRSNPAGSFWFLFAIATLIYRQRKHYNTN